VALWLGSSFDPVLAEPLALVVGVARATVVVGVVPGDVCAPADPTTPTARPAAPPLMGPVATPAIASRSCIHAPCSDRWHYAQRFNGPRFKVSCGEVRGSVCTASPLGLSH